MAGAKHCLATWVEICVRLVYCIWLAVTRLHVISYMYNKIYWLFFYLIWDRNGACWGLTSCNQTPSITTFNSMNKQQTWYSLRWIDQYIGVCFVCYSHPKQKRGQYVGLTNDHYQQYNCKIPVIGLTKGSQNRRSEAQICNSLCCAS